MGVAILVEVGQPITILVDAVVPQLGGTGVHGVLVVVAVQSSAAPGVVAVAVLIGWETGAAGVDGGVTGGGHQGEQHKGTELRSHRIPSSKPA
jgi:hypothetical protein